MAAAAATEAADFGGSHEHVITLKAQPEAGDALRTPEGEKAEVLRRLLDMKYWKKVGKDAALPNVAALKAEALHVFGTTAISNEAQKTAQKTRDAVEKRIGEVQDAAKRRNGVSIGDALSWDGSAAQTHLRRSLEGDVPQDLFARLCGMAGAQEA